MKVVINHGYGGFGLSAEGLAYYYQLKGEGDIYYYEAVRGQKRELYKRVTPHLLARPFLKDFGKGPVHISQADHERYAVDAYDRVTFAGATNWYGLKSESEQAFFTQRSNDSQLIYHLPIHELHDAEMAAYEQLQPVDVIVTHVPPIHIKSHVLNGYNDCYLNELHDVKAKHYIFGHCHEQHIYEKEIATYHINALGYPDEKLPRKIQLFTV